MTTLKTTLVRTAAVLCGVCALSLSAFAQDAGRKALPPKHDSNTLHKLGKAVQYPVRKLGENTSHTAHKTARGTQYIARKTGENASVTAHQATGKESVIRRRHKKVNRKVTAGGRLTTMHGKTMTQLKHEREAAARRRHHRHH